MKPFITLEEAIRNKVINECDPVDPTGLFSAKNARVVLSSKQTGYKEEQSFLREDLKWFYAKDRLGLPAIWGSATREVLVLRGKIGYENALADINSVCQMYTNIKLGMIARSIEEDDTSLIYRDYSKIQKSFLANLTNYATEEFTLFGIRIADQYGVKNCYLCSSYDYCDQVAYPVRPVIPIYLPNKILVDVNSIWTGKMWKLTKNKC